MALKATIFKIQLNIADLQRHYYQQHTLTIARHPSENNARMMARVLAFALNADEQLHFTKGLSTTDEPDLWRKQDHGQIAHWIEVGQPDERRIKQSCGRAQHMSIYCYSGRSADIWWEGLSPSIKGLNNLSVYRIDEAAITTLGQWAERNMEVFCNIDEEHLSMTFGEHNLNIEVTPWQVADTQ